MAAAIAPPLIPFLFRIPFIVSLVRNFVFLHLGSRLLCCKRFDVVLGEDPSSRCSSWVGGSAGCGIARFCAVIVGLMLGFRSRNLEISFYFGTPPVCSFFQGVEFGVVNSLGLLC